MLHDVVRFPPDFDWPKFGYSTADSEHCRLIQALLKLATIVCRSPRFSRKLDSAEGNTPPVEGKTKGHYKVMQSAKGIAKQTS